MRLTDDLLDDLALTLIPRLTAIADTAPKPPAPAPPVRRSRPEPIRSPLMRSVPTGRAVPTSEQLRMLRAARAETVAELKRITVEIGQLEGWETA